MKKICFFIPVYFITLNLYAQFNLFDKVQNKVNDRANQKVDEGIDKGLDETENGIKNSAKKKDNDKSNADKNAKNNNQNNDNSTAETSKTQDNIKAYNNYDFIPGEKILFEDNFADSPDGEFPPHWDLISGQAVVNKVVDKPAFCFTDGNYAIAKPVMKTENYLTDPFTAEFDFYIPGGGNNPLIFFKTSNDDENTKALSFGEELKTNYFTNELSGKYPGPGEDLFYNKWHHAAVAYKGGQMKCYIDQYRVLVIPKCGFVPEAVKFGGIGAQDIPLTISNVRIATGGAMNMLNKIMTDGKFITHAITFDVNKSTIKPESMGFLNEFAKFLKDNSSLKLEIDGHTDSDGADDKNMKLSQSRADAVKTQLISMGIDGSRFTTKGFGKTKPISDNNTIEGKANNRRVEFIKM